MPAITTRAFGSTTTTHHVPGILACLSHVSIVGAERRYEQAPPLAVDLSLLHLGIPAPMLRYQGLHFGHNAHFGHSPPLDVRSCGSAATLRSFLSAYKGLAKARKPAQAPLEALNPPHRDFYRYYAIALNILTLVRYQFLTKT